MLILETKKRENANDTSSNETRSHTRIFKRKYFNLLSPNNSPNCIEVEKKDKRSLIINTAIPLQKYSFKQIDLVL